MYIERRSFIRIISFLCAVIIILTGACVFINYERNNYKTAIENDYIAAFEELSSHLYNIETAFYKGLYSNSAYQMMKMATKVWGEALAAKTNLEGLIGYNNDLSNVSQFLSKAGDYVYYAALKRVKNEELTDEEIKNLEELAKISSALSENVTSISQRLNSGEINYDEITTGNILGQEFESGELTLSSDLVSSVDQVSTYPELIYDGPFSDHIEKQEPVFLKDLGQITRDEAQNRLSKWFNIDINEIEFAYESNSKIPFFVFTFGDTTASVSKQGGYLVEVVNSRVFEQCNIDIQTATATAQGFLENTGYSNMDENYYYTLGNEVTINFAYKSENVIIYPDLIKVTVSLQTGEITGFEAFGYLMAHREDRDLKVSASEESAKNKVNSNLKITDSNIALIPTDGKNEVLCYEFVTKTEDGRSVLVYINANTLTEEMLQILVENESGTLTK